MRKESRRKERICVDYEDIYIADDGTEFNNEEECKKYERTADGVINAAFEKTKFGNVIYGLGDRFCQFGCDENMFCVHITDEHDLNAVNMWVSHHSARPVYGYYDIKKDDPQFGKDAIGTIQVFSESDYDDPYEYGSIEQLREYMHKSVDELIDSLTKEKEEE